MPARAASCLALVLGAWLPLACSGTDPAGSPALSPSPCVAQGVQCGPLAHGGTTVDCGACHVGARCEEGACVEDDCVPTTSCAARGAVCGPLADGCGRVLPCGECDGEDVCIAGACVPPGAITHERADNPFAGADFYVDPDYAAQVAASQALAPPDVQPGLARLRTMPTAVWLDRIAAIAGTAERRGLVAHLEAALEQQALGADPRSPMVVVIVVYDLPGRDCAAFASNGELPLGDGGQRAYREDYIDAIVAALQRDPRARTLRIVAVIEPDSLPNLVTNLGLCQTCRDAAAAYRDGVAYAISRLAALDNVYLYLDIAHSGWLGWEHTGAAADLYEQILEAAGGADLIRGFATNVANYSSLEEAFDPYTDVGRYRDVIEGFYEWNQVIDELTFVERLRSRFPDKGFIIDTGRNGWRPRGAELPLDARTHRGNWCNVAGAGLGERPRADPRPGVDAYYWIKPPGESDGTSDPGATLPDEEGKRYDPMCGQAPVERPYAPGRAIPTDALPGAPPAGHWFHDQLLMLVRNATPPL